MPPCLQAQLPSICSIARRNQAIRGRSPLCRDHIGPNGPRPLGEESRQPHLHHRRETRELQGRTVGYYVMRYGAHTIWGATAGMLVNLYRHLAE